MKRVFFYIMMLMLAGNVSLLAQYDPHGAVDTVTVGNVMVPPSGAFSVPVKLVNDEEIRAFSIPLNYDKSTIAFDSVSFRNSRAAGWTFLNSMHDDAAGKVLVGGLSLDDFFIPAGSGVLVNLYFHPVEDASIGKSATIDSSFVPPAGEFVVTAFDNVSIQPAFQAGSVLITDADQPPLFTPLTRKVVNEGDTLTVELSAIDPEGSAITLAGENLPKGAMLIDNGDGSGLFKFVAPFVGPGSATDSPFDVIFSASAGSSMGYVTLPVEVVNVNRPPQFSGNASAIGSAGDTIYLPVVAVDPDYEQVTLSSSNLPAGAELSGVSPGYFSWPSKIADSGSFAVTVTAVDESGGTASRQMQFSLSPTVPIDLSIDDEQAFNSSNVEVDISLHNRVDVASFRLLVQFDETVLHLNEITRSGTRIEQWQVFNTLHHSGDANLWIIGEADSSGLDVDSLAPGDGPIVRLLFTTSSDYGMAGYYSRISFAFIDADSVSDNYFYMPDSTFIGYSLIDYKSGGVLIKAYDALVGDINLNGITFEVADLVYFSHYFTDPFHYPLDGARWINSDINQDGQPGTLADLIYMEGIINGDNPKSASSDEAAAASYQDGFRDGDYVYCLSTKSALRAACYKFVLNGADNVQLYPSSALGNAEISVGRQGDTLRVLLLGANGATFNASGDELFRVKGSSQIDLISQSYVNNQGAVVSLSRSAVDLNLPTSYDLAQNYPNPFNPQTTISFAMPTAGVVKLEVFNVLGQKISTLLDDYLPAGHHEVVFAGEDGHGHELASGVYFYRLRVGTFESSRKMLLLK